MSATRQTLYAVGKIEKALGLKGEVVVKPLTGLPERFNKLKHVYVGKRADQADEFAVEYVRVERKGVRLKFAETPDRTSAEPLVGSLIFVDEEHRIVPKKGSYFIHDVVGMNVVDEQENSIGVVKDVLQFPAQDIYVVERDGQEWMIPAVKEFVRSIDPATRTMKIRLIEGLMER